MKLIAFSFLFISSLAFSSQYDYSKKLGLGASFGYNAPIFGHTFNTEADGAETFSLHARYHLNSNHGLEAAFSKHEFDDTTKALNVYDVLFFKRLSPLERFTPVIGAGLGVVDVDNYPSDESLKLGLKLRGGLEYALSQCFSLGLNLDYQQVNKMFFRKNLDERTIHVLAGRVGLTWFLGGQEKKTAPAQKAAATSPRKPLDSDKDGVVDSEDKCPETSKGAAVNAYGCAEEEKAEVKLNVQFASAKSSIDSRYDQDLKTLATFMSTHSNTRVEIQGHTDNTGSKSLNKKLSLVRAEAVKAYLVEKLGVDSTRLTTKGYGDEFPIANNSSDLGKQANRRVVAIISE